MGVEEGRREGGADAKEGNVVRAEEGAKRVGRVESEKRRARARN